jgi:hypothetical protein
MTADALMLAKHLGELLGLGLALPIHYAAAGVAGATLGVGLGQALEHNYQQTAREVSQGERQKRHASS